MPSTPATSFVSHHNCSSRQKQKQPTETTTTTTLPPSPEQTDCDSINNSASTDDEDEDEVIIERAFDVIWANFCALPTPNYPTFHFKNPSAFEILQTRFDEHVGLSQFVHDKVRLDWNADTCDLILRLMPTFVHDTFQDLVKFALEAELNRVARDYPELEPTRRQITSAGHSSVEKGAGRFSKSPDGHLAFKGTNSSPFFFEVAYSEAEKVLLNKVYEYFTEVPGCTILTFDLDYAAPSTRRAEGHVHGASVSLATSMPDPEDPDSLAVEELVEAEMFREAGQALEGNLEIPFRLFVPLEQRGDLPPSAAAASVCFSFAELAQFLSDAEELQRIRDVTPEPGKQYKNINWRKRNGDVTRVAVDPKRPRTRSRRARPEGPPRRSRRLGSASTRPTTD
ncbi:hypothetical protein F4782DRAFT_524458 [Xylaria castorea]|nr:hypothetical protein F4782DRAFT_524458 [Xylaria castorea]